MSHQDENTRLLRQQRKAELEAVLFRHGFEIVNNDSGTVYIRVCAGGANADPAEPLMLDYKRDVSNFILFGYSTPHDIAMHFVHRYAFRTQAWVKPLES